MSIEKIERNTHLIDWLNDGWTHCQHGTREWCEGYLHNARDVIKAQDDELSRLREVALLVAAPIENFPGPDWTKIGLTKIIQKFQNRAARALSEREGPDG